MYICTKATDRETLSGLILIGLGGLQGGQGVRADECFVILRRGLYEGGAQCGVV